MPIYRLKRMSDGETFDADARDYGHALVVFGHRLGANLTLEEGLAAPQYMMGRIEKEPSWMKPLDIAVYEVRQNSN